MSLYLRSLLAQPKKIFVRSSLSAINKWRFKPVLDKSARAVWQHDVRYTMEYKLKGAPSFNHQYFNRAYAQAKSGNPIAQAKYGFLKQNIRDYVYLDNHSYSYWYLRAAIQGVPFAQFAVGENLIYGQGNKLDKSKGVQWLTRAASNGVVEASELLAKISIKIPQNRHKKRLSIFLIMQKKQHPQPGFNLLAYLLSLLTRKSEIQTRLSLSLKFYPGANIVMTSPNRKF